MTVQPEIGVGVDTGDEEGDGDGPGPGLLEHAVNATARAIIKQLRSTAHLPDLTASSARIAQNAPAVDARLSNAAGAALRFGADVRTVCRRATSAVIVPVASAFSRFKAHLDALPFSTAGAARNRYAVAKCVEQIFAVFVF